MKILTDIQSFMWLNFRLNRFICPGIAQINDSLNFFKDFSSSSNYINEDAWGECPHELEHTIISDYSPNLY